RLLDDLQADLGSPSNREVERVITQSSSSSRVSRARSPPGLGRSDGMALELSSPQLVRRSSTGRGVSPSPGGLGVVRSREEFTTPDKKTRVVTEKYSKEDRLDLMIEALLFHSRESKVLNIFTFHSIHIKEVSYMNFTAAA
ncbi:unnamed protein product, partial [Cyprideis torosa]